MTTIEAIDQRICTIQLELIALRRQRNALFAPICGLPAELKVHILKYAQYEDYYESGRDQNALDAIFPHHRIKYSRSWVHLTVICQSWRDTALAAPELWLCIETHASLSWRNICIDRARGLPPVVHTHYPTHGWSTEQNQATLDAASSQLPRAIGAFLALGGDESFRDMFKNLECLCLKYLHLESWQLSVNDEFMGGALPSITSLDITVVDIQATLECPNLRHLRLKVHRPKKNSSGRIMMKWLAKSPRIEILSLDMNCDKLNLSTDDETDGVELPLLCLLRLRGTMDICRKLLNKLSNPGPQVGLRVDATDKYYGWVDSDEKPLLQAAYRKLMRLITQHRENKTTGPLRARFTCSSQSMIHLTSIPDPPYRVSVESDQPWCEFNGPYVPGAFKKFSSVAVLHLEGDRGIWIAPPQHITDEDSPFKGVELMKCLDTVIIESAKTIGYVNTLGKWLTKRKAKEQPVRLLKIVSTATDKAKKTLETLTARLLDEQVINEVEWSSCQ